MSTSSPPPSATTRASASTATARPACRWWSNERVHPHAAGGPGGTADRRGRRGRRGDARGGAARRSLDRYDSEGMSTAARVFSSLGPRVWIFGALALALAAFALLAPPLATPLAFRSLADTRGFLGIPNFADVVSNLPLLLVGLWGLHASRSGGWPWRVTFLMVALTGPCSAYYHLAPDDARLMWDRLPISMAFMALLAAVLAERIGARVGERLLVPLVLAGAASVLYWRWSVLQGAENILPYAAVQFGGMAAIVLAV